MEPEKDMDKKKILFIVNPKSGMRKKRNFERKIRLFLDHSAYAPTVVYTTKSGHATELAKNALSEGIKFLVAVGGDGTINEIGQVVAGTDAVLGIIPAGSGNGLARHLGLPVYSMKKAIGIINRCKVKRIDTALINDKVFLSTAGIGYDAHVAKKMASAKTRGLLTYFWIVSHEYLNYGPRKYTIDIDGQRIERKAFLITLANSSQFGYNTAISPEARVDDGFIDVCIVRKIPFLLVPFVIPRLFSRSFHKTHYIEIIRGKNVSIERKQGKSVHFDGDYYAMGKSLTMNINPSSLNIIIP